MTSITGVITDPAVGGTFLTWSLHFLAGHTKYYNARHTEYRPVSSDIFSDGNAHGFKPSQPIVVQEYFNFISGIQSQTSHPDFHTVYFHCLTENDNWQETVIKTRKAIDHFGTTGYPIVLLTTNNKQYFYYSVPRSTNKDSSTEYDHLPVWDKREWLSFKKIYHGSIRESFDFGLAHFPIDTLELVNTFDKSVYQLFDYLNLTMDKDRYTTWLQIWHEWRHFHYARMQFMINHDIIIDYILNGTNMDLKRFNLDIMQEASIMFTLRQKGYELAQYGVEQFDSTGQLYDLLHRS